MRSANFWAGGIALLAQVAREAEQRYGSAWSVHRRGDRPRSWASAFLGAESLLLLGFDRNALPIRSALRRFSVGDQAI